MRIYTDNGTIWVAKGYDIPPTQYEKLIELYTVFPSINPYKDIHYNDNKPATMEFVDRQWAAFDHLLSTSMFYAKYANQRDSYWESLQWSQLGLSIIEFVGGELK